MCEAEALLKEYAARGLTFCAAESCTGGLIGKLITDQPGASAVFYGSVVSYANEVKMRALGVREETLAAHGAVSVETAAEMAAGARRLCGADAAVSVTGIAGPGGGSAEKPVGTVCFGVSTEHGTTAERVQFDPSLTREEIRRAAAAYAMKIAVEKGLQL